MTFSLWTAWKMTFQLKTLMIIFFPPLTYNMFLSFRLSRPIPWEISIKLSWLSSSLSRPNLSLSLSLGLWQNVILFFTPDVISNLIEVHFCPPVLWIKMGSFYGRRCAAPWLSTLSFRLPLAWRWIVWRLCELHKLTCESCGAAGEGEAADSPFRSPVEYPSRRSGGAAGCFSEEASDTAVTRWRCWGEVMIHNYPIRHNHYWLELIHKPSALIYYVRFSTL